MSFFLGVPSTSSLSRGLFVVNFRQRFFCACRQSFGASPVLFVIYHGSLTVSGDYRSSSRLDSSPPPCSVHRSFLCSQKPFLYSMCLSFYDCERLRLTTYVSRNKIIRGTKDSQTTVLGFSTAVRPTPLCFGETFPSLQLVVNLPDPWFPNRRRVSVVSET